MFVKTVLDGYRAAASDLRLAWKDLSTEVLLAPVAGYLPASGSDVLDVGAGTGRDARWFSARGCAVTAVEPVEALRAGEVADASVRWVDDILPHLVRVSGTFDLILLAAVWHHLPPDDRGNALARLRALVRPGGHVLMSLRHGPNYPDRPAFEIDLEQLRADAVAAGFDWQFECAHGSLQARNRAAGVTWTWVVLGPSNGSQ